IRDRNVTGVQTCALPISQVVSVVHDYSAWALQAILAPVTTYESSFALAIVVIHAVVVLVQHGEILRVRLSAIFVCFHVVRLAARSVERRVGEWWRREVCW